MGGADWRDGGAGRYCAVGLAREAVSDGEGWEGRRGGASADRMALSGGAWARWGGAVRAVGEGVCVGEGCVWERWALCPSEAAGGVHLWEGRQWWRWGGGGAATGGVGGR